MAQLEPMLEAQRAARQSADESYSAYAAAVDTFLGASATRPSLGSSGDGSKAGTGGAEPLPVLALSAVAARPSAAPPSATSPQPAPSQQPPPPASNIPPVPPPPPPARVGSSLQDVDDYPSHHPPPPQPPVAVAANTPAHNPPPATDLGRDRDPYPPPVADVELRPLRGGAPRDERRERPHPATAPPSSEAHAAIGDAQQPPPPVVVTLPGQVEGHATPTAAPAAGNRGSIGGGGGSAGSGNGGGVDKDGASLSAAAPLPPSHTGGGATRGTAGADEVRPVSDSDAERPAPAYGAATPAPAEKAGVVAVAAGEVTEEKLAHLFERREVAQLTAMGGTAAVVAWADSHVEAGIEGRSSPDDRRERWGANRLPPAEEVTFFALVLDALRDRLLQMLIVAAVVSIALEMGVASTDYGVVGCKVEATGKTFHRTTGWIEGFAILVSVTLVVLVGSVNNYRKALKFQELEAATSKVAVNVWRNATWLEVDSTEVVVGDLLQVVGGQLVCADAIYLHGQDVRTEESAVTGESDPKKKDAAHDPLLISGSSVETGECVALVVAVGERSFNGIQMMKTRQPPALTPMQEKLEVLAEMIGRFGMVAATLTLLVLVALEIAHVLTTEGASWEPVNFLEFVTIAIAIVVVAIPEGLPLAVTIALAYSMNRMMEDRCQVRHLAACETMGAATAICSDKTGTLTTNEMTVVQAWVAGGTFADTTRQVSALAPLFSSPASSPPRGDEAARAETAVVGEMSSPAGRALFCDAVAMNSRATWVETENVKVLPDGRKLVEKDARWAGGNKTEEALLRASCAVLQCEPAELVTQRQARASAGRHVYPFNSEKKRATAIVLDVSRPVGAGRVVVYVQGASELVLAAATAVVGLDGATTPMTPEIRAALEATILRMAKDGNRTLCLAFARGPDAGSWAAAVESGGAFPEEEPTVERLAVIAIVGIQDPMRREVPAAVAACQRAGITVRMVTGDNIDTAKSIAAKCGIYGGEDSGHVAMEGVAFRKMAAADPLGLAKMLPNLRVLARSSPTDKHVLAAALIRAGDVVAMTGDGTNDAPALKLAHVGFAMDVGTQIAKSASDIVLMDNNFVSVVKACMWGRNVNDAVRKFIQFQLTINFVGVLITFIGAVASPRRESLLRPVQLLWLNLIMDTFAALALSTEQPSPALLERMPVYRDHAMISRRMWSFIVGHGLYQLGVQLVFVFMGWRWVCDTQAVKDKAFANCSEAEFDTLERDMCFSSPEHVTLVFNSFVLMQVVNQLNARKLFDEKWSFEGLSRSPIFLMITLVTAAFQVIAVEVEYINQGMGCAKDGLSWLGWVLSIGVALLEFPLGFLIKCIPITSEPPPTGPSFEEQARLATEEAAADAAAEAERAAAASAADAERRAAAVRDEARREPDTRTPTAGAMAQGSSDRLGSRRASVPAGGSAVLRRSSTMLGSFRVVESFRPVRDHVPAELTVQKPR